MQKVVTAAEMREIDRKTSEVYGIPSLLLMENAAHAAARAIADRFGGAVREKSILILCGTGNNGGDGAALARILWTMGADVEVCLFGNIADTKGDAQTNFEILEKITDRENFGFAQSDLAIEEFTTLEEWLEYTAVNFHADEPDVVIDAIFGTGLTRPLDGLHEQAAAYISAYSDDDETLVVALDVPSGLNADSEKTIGISVCADLTVTFTAPKRANVFPPAANFNGELLTANIGSPYELIENSASQIFVAEKADADEWICKTCVRKKSYKKTRGTALIVAGSKNYSGAAVLAANGCFAAGAGMVSLAVPESTQSTAAAKVSEEIIIRGFAETKKGAFAESAVKEILELSGKMHVVALGCGLSSEEPSTKKFVREIVENRNTPMVLDADGLNALAPFDLQGSDEFPLVLTPHIGEFQRLSGKKKIEQTIEAAQKFAGKHNVILLLKGERSIVAAPDGRTVINPTGNAGISRAGAGDTLTGIITSFLAQTYGIEPPNLENTFRTVVAALYISGLAGDIAAKNLSHRLLKASDIRHFLKEAISSVGE